MKRATIYTPEHAELVLLLKDLRLKAGLSQAEVAETLERPQTYVSAVEVGQRGVDLLQVRELSAIYGMSLPAFVELFEERLKTQESERRPPRRRRRSS
jgi:transcriptional regulator with XRE-family HTH domain